MIEYEPMEEENAKEEEEDEDKDDYSYVAEVILTDLSLLKTFNAFNF